MTKENFGDLPNDQKIEISLDHRTFLILKNPDRPTVAEICIVGAQGTRDDMALIDIEPGAGNAVQVYYNDPKEVVFVRSLPMAEFEEDKKHRG